MGATVGEGVGEGVGVRKTLLLSDVPGRGTARAVKAKRAIVPTCQMKVVADTSILSGS